MIVSIFAIELTNLPSYLHPICLNTSQICAAISRVGARIITWRSLLRSNFSNAIIVKTAVLPVPDFASNIKSKTNTSTYSHL